MEDITLNRGTDQNITFQYYESDGETKRALTGATVFFTLKENSWDSDADDSDAPLKKSVTSHTDAATGLTTIELTDTETALDPKNYFYDIKVKESDGKIYKAAYGRCLIDPSPTNRTT